MADQLSGIAIIICIAFGVLTFILLFIFAKRQITRFALKSRRGPHVAVGTDASKNFIQKIERQLILVKKIRYEPGTLKKENQELFSDLHTCKQIFPPHLYRMKVLDDIKELDVVIASKQTVRCRSPGEDVLIYFQQLHQAGIFSNLSLPNLYKFLALYEHARHEPEVFSYEEYYSFYQALQSIKSSLFKVVDEQPNNAVKNNLLTDESADKGHRNENTSLLLNRTISFSNRSSKRIRPNETPV